jgi:hypothetical protein
VPTTFLVAKEFIQALILSPIVGFFGGGIFTGFAVYLPELFPTAVRATAQGFCYKFARFFSAGAPFLTGAPVSAPRRFFLCNHDCRRNLPRGHRGVDLRAGNQGPNPAD